MIRNQRGRENEHILYVLRDVREDVHPEKAFEDDRGWELYVHAHVREGEGEGGNWRKDSSVKKKQQVGENGR